MPFGIQNIGSTCYINSVLQCIHSTPVLKQVLSKYSGECPVTSATRDVNVPSLLEHMTQFSKEPHDPHEFILALIDHLEKTLGKDLFYGVVKSKFITCDGKSTETISEFGSLMFHSTEMDIDKPDYIIDGGIGKFSCKKLTYEKMPKVLICLFVKPVVTELPKVYKDKTLTSCVVHFPGHYISCVKEDDKWFMIDDDKIYQTDENFRAPIYIAVYS